MPAAAITPAWRIEPPWILRVSRAASMKAAFPHRIEPTGADSPLETQNITESTCSTSSAAGTP